MCKTVKMSFQIRSGVDATSGEVGNFFRNNFLSRLHGSYLDMQKSVGNLHPLFTKKCYETQKDSLLNILTEKILRTGI